MSAALSSFTLGCASPPAPTRPVPAKGVASGSLPPASERAHTPLVIVHSSFGAGCKK